MPQILRQNLAVNYGAITYGKAMQIVLVFDGALSLPLIEIAYVLYEVYLCRERL